LRSRRSISSMARISYVRQKEPLGLGHAVLCAKDLIGDEPFAVLLPDDVMTPSRPAEADDRRLQRAWRIGACHDDYRWPRITPMAF